LGGFEETLLTIKTLMSLAWCHYFGNNSLFITINSKEYVGVSSFELVVYLLQQIETSDSLQ
jgi:hypothetical protein